jgi:hypothetical protein
VRPTAECGSIITARMLAKLPVEFFVIGLSILIAVACTISNDAARASSLV